MHQLSPSSVTLLFALALALALPSPVTATESVRTPAPAASTGRGPTMTSDPLPATPAPACSRVDLPSAATDGALAAVASTPGRSWAVGFMRRGREGLFSRRRPIIMRSSGGAWTIERPPTPGRDDGLVAVAERGAEVWAVGFTTIAGVIEPLALQRLGGTWRVARPRAPGAYPATLTDVVLRGDGHPWAVGYRVAADGGRRPIAAQRHRGHWRYDDPATRPGESVTLTGAALDGRGGLWAVGHGGRAGRTKPVVYRRTHGRWLRSPVPTIAGEAVLVDVIAAGAHDAWAVGYRRAGGRTYPLVLRWDGGHWRPTAAPGGDTGEGMLSAVSVGPGGSVWVVGSRWDTSGDRAAMAARWDGRAWSIAEPGPAGSDLRGVAGSPTSDGWAVGQIGRGAFVTRVCEPLMVAQVTDPLLTDTARDTVPGAVSPRLAEVRAPGARRHNADRPRANGAPAQRRARRRPVPPLPRPRRDPVLVARDIAAQVGLDGRTSTSGAIVADFDGDGVDDLYLGRRGRPARLLLARGDRFVDDPSMVFPRIDRLGCAVADVDASGLPDLYCVIGAQRGLGIKSNELWLDPGGPSPIDAAADAGVTDPAGRGRLATFLRSPDGTLDLVIANAPFRVDGLPSPNRLLRTSGDGRFSAVHAGDLPRQLGGLALQAADYDGDGRDDLLLVTGGEQAPGAPGTHLYRGTTRGLVDVSDRVGILSMGTIDAELADLDGDGHLDLVELAPSRLRVSLWRAGRFETTYRRRLSHGRALASGDADGDGHPDLYIVRADSRGNPRDVLLLTRRHGHRFRPLVIPQVRVGDGQDVVPIDAAGSGLMDFLVLNGRTRSGPLQLIGLFRRPTG